MRGVGTATRPLTKLGQHQDSALFVIADPLYASRRVRLLALAAKNGMPASYAFREFSFAGGF